MKKRVISLNVNGAERDLLVHPNRVLLEVLREELHLTGTKFGCELGECGACTVLVDDVPVLSCLTLASLCEGKRITTVEGLEGRYFEAVRRAFMEEGASQCGYCTPAMVLMVSYLVGKGGDIDIRRELSGNICRCTGYTKILRAYEKSLEFANE